MKTDACGFLSALFAPYAAYSSARIEIRAFPPAWATNTGKPPRAWYREHQHQPQKEEVDRHRILN